MNKPANGSARASLKRRHVAAATLGNALEFYDFLTYAFFSIQIGHAFFPVQSAYGSLMLSLATFGAGFVTRPIGALVIGAYADRVGRRPAMMLCFVLIGTSIAGMALIPTYAAIGLAAPILEFADVGRHAGAKHPLIECSRHRQDGISNRFGFEAPHGKMMQQLILWIDFLFRWVRAARHLVGARQQD